MKKIAVITGAGKKRIGWHIAKKLGAEGYSLVLTYRSDPVEAESNANELRTFGFNVSLECVELSDELQVQQFFRSTVEKHGAIDLLVNCASIWVKKRIEATNARDLMENFKANVIATFLCSQLAGEIMVNQKQGGHIITIGDWATKRPYRDYSAYFATKGSITTLSRCLAVEFGSRNPSVRVNCIQPGPVMVPTNLPESERNESIMATLVQREGSPEDVAEAVVFLEKSKFLTGIEIPVDGGRSIWARGY